MHDLSDLFPRFQGLDIQEDDSKSKIKRKVREGATFKCITCWHEFDKKGQLSKHLIRKRHYKSTKELSEERQELELRTQARSRDQYTQAEENTYLVISLKYAHLIATG